MVFSEASKTVERFLNAARQPGDFVHNTAAILVELERLGDACAPAFIKSLEHEDGFKRTITAWFLLNLHAQRPASVSSSQALRKASAILAQGLKSSDVLIRDMTCMFLASGVPHRNLVAPLRRMTRDKETIPRTVAATALARIKPSRLLVPILREGLASTNQSLAMQAAHGLALMERHREEGIDALLRLLDEVDDTLCYSILTLLKQLGGNTPGATSSLCAIAGDPNRAVELRSLAIQALSHVAGVTPEGNAAIDTALRSGVTPLVRGAFDGLRETKRFERKHIEAIGEYLDSEVLALRVAAAEGLAGVGEEARYAMPQMLARIGVETDADATEGLICALANIPDHSFPELIKIVLEHDQLKLAMVHNVLVRMGERGASRITASLTEVEDLQLLVVFLTALRDLGVRAASAVALLGEFLDHVESDELAALTLMVIAATGPASLRAAEALVRCVATRPDELANIARTALWNAGPDAIPFIERARIEATGVERDRLSQILAGVRTADQGRFAKYEALTEKQVETLVRVGEILAEGKPMSYRRLPDELRRRTEGKRAVVRRDGWSANNIKNYVDSLEQILAPAQFVEVKAGSRSIALTQEGATALGELRECLQARRVRRGDVPSA